MATLSLLPFSGMAGHPVPAQDAHEMPCHSDGGDAQQEKAACPGMHACCGAVLAASTVDTPASPPRARPPVHAASLPAGFFPDLVDRPPVAL